MEHTFWDQRYTENKVSKDPMMQPGALPKKAFQQVIKERLLQKEIENKFLIPDYQKSKPSKGPAFFIISTKPYIHLYRSYLPRLFVGSTLPFIKNKSGGNPFYIKELRQGFCRIIYRQR